jgi:hypothetical protein
MAQFWARTMSATICFQLLLPRLSGGILFLWSAHRLRCNTPFGRCRFRGAAYEIVGCRTRCQSTAIETVQALLLPNRE